MYWKQSDSTGVERFEAIHEGAGAIRVREFFREQGRTGVRFHVWELAPGASEGSHVHFGEEGYEETYYFLAGRGVMSIDGEEVPVAAGDALLVPPGVDHGLRNTGDGPLRLVLLFGKPRDSGATSR
jgi:mannose-6-phosphate isomerase-like protein (cupin superfamily)